MQNPETNDTRARVERLFEAYERGDSESSCSTTSPTMSTGPSPERIPYQVNIAASVSSSTPPTKRLATVLQEPGSAPRAANHRRWRPGRRGVARSRNQYRQQAPRDDYCWIIRVAEDQIVEVMAYFDGLLVEELFRSTEQ
jgi:hypothetical protein